MYFETDFQTFELFSSAFKAFKSTGRQTANCQTSWMYRGQTLQLIGMYRGQTLQLMGMYRGQTLQLRGMYRDRHYTLICIVQQ